MWEDNKGTQLLRLIENKKIVEKRESVVDNWIWKDDKQLGFSVKYAYNSLKVVVGGEDRDIFERFWKVKVLPSAQITTWRVLNNSIATKDNLLRKRVLMVSYLCGLCGEEEEIFVIYSLSVKLCGKFGE